MISGESDHIWNSCGDGRRRGLASQEPPLRLQLRELEISARRPLAGRQEFVPAWHGEIRNPTSGRENDLGGSAEGDARSSIDSIPKVLAFLRKNLAGLQ
jgi:hypothetical protein